MIVIKEFQLLNY